MKGIGYKLSRAQSTWPMTFRVLLVIGILIDITAMVAFSLSLQQLGKLNAKYQQSQAATPAEVPAASVLAQVKYADSDLSHDGVLFGMGVAAVGFIILIPRIVFSYFVFFMRYTMGLNAKIRCVRLVTSFVVIAGIASFSLLHFMDYFLIAWVGIEAVMTLVLWSWSKADDGENFTLQD